MQAIDPSTTRVFVGAVNSLYDLTSADLTVRRHVQTGPQDDSPLCRGKWVFLAKNLEKIDKKSIFFFIPKKKFFFSKFFFQLKTPKFIDFYFFIFPY